MKKWVDAYDAHLAEGGSTSLRKFYAEKNIYQDSKIPASTFYSYANKDKSKRTPLETQVGPKPRGKSGDGVLFQALRATAANMARQTGEQLEQEPPNNAVATDNNGEKTDVTAKKLSALFQALHATAANMTCQTAEQEQPPNNTTAAAATNNGNKSNAVTPDELDLLFKEFLSVAGNMADPDGDQGSDDPAATEEDLAKKRAADRKALGEHYDALEDLRLRQKMRIALKKSRMVSHTPAQRRARHRFWTKALPMVCTKLQKDDDFLQAEKDLMSRCLETFGSSEAIYTGPSLSREVGPDVSAYTSRRRAGQEKEIWRFETTQLRHELAIRKSGWNMRRLLVTIDTFLKKYDNIKAYHGLERTNFCSRLREDFTAANAVLGKRKRQGWEVPDGGIEEMLAHGIDPMFSEKEREIYCHSYRAEFARYSSKVDDAEDWELESLGDADHKEGKAEKEGKAKKEGKAEQEGKAEKDAPKEDADPCVQEQQDAEKEVSEPVEEIDDEEEQTLLAAQYHLTWTMPPTSGRRR